MKKIILSFAACLMCVTLLAACGGNNASKTNSGSTSSTVTSSTVTSGDTTSSEAGTTSSEAGTTSSEAGEPSSEASTANTGTGAYSTLEDFVNSDEMQEQINAVIDSMKDSGIDVDVTAEGNKLIYLYTYPESALEGVDMEALTTTLDEALESSASTFEGIASSLKSAVNIDDPVVVVTYAQPDGTPITSKEFAAK